MAENQKFLALLIDGDNAQAALIPEILDAVGKHGNPIIKKVYGDWTQDQLKCWKPLASKYNLEIEHNYNASSGKNATDIALVIDAMDLLYQRGEKLNGFCFVSSDSDFTHLARRIRKEGLTVIGVGSNRSQTLKEAYNHFITLEGLKSQNQPLAPEKLQRPIEEITDTRILRLIVKAHKQATANGGTDEQGRMMLRDIWGAIKTSDDEFSSEYQQLPKFVNKAKMLAEARPDLLGIAEQPDSKPPQHYVTIKTAKKADSSEIQKFRAAYKHAIESLKPPDKNGWVDLGAIGNTLRELYPNYQPLVYGGVKHSQLKKVVEKMIVDHPKVIELKTTGLTVQMRIKQ